MRITKARTSGVVALAAVAGATALGAQTTSAQKYDPPKGPKKVTIEMVAKGKKLSFSGPSKVAKGAKLEIVNLTEVKKVGPHTASLVEPVLIPKGKAEFKACARELAPETVCGAIATVHKVDFETFKVAKPDVDVGKKGWDTAFGEKGDTWYTETLDESETRKVSAKAGTTLTLFCAIHPEMVKKLKVTG